MTCDEQRVAVKSTSRIRNLRKGKTAGLCGAVAAVASSVVVVSGLISAPIAGATPYRTHSVGDASTNSSLVSPHTPPDTRRHLTWLSARPTSAMPTPS